MSSPGAVPAKGDASTSVTTAVTAAEPGPPPPPAPPPPPLFLAAQQGDLGTLRELLSSSQASATDRDAGNITALHWAAINNRLLVCKELLSYSADVDAVGGELLATPLQWAAR
jgi:palmitoyltransferase ZDHHC13/17